MPERCIACGYCHIEGDSGYYPLLRCQKNYREIIFNEKNGWDIMVWCPVRKEYENVRNGLENGSR
jgi:hypothetical protein